VEVYVLAVIGLYSVFLPRYEALPEPFKVGNKRKQGRLDVAVPAEEDGPELGA